MFASLVFHHLICFKYVSVPCLATVSSVIHKGDSFISIIHFLQSHY